MNIEETSSALNPIVERFHIKQAERKKYSDQRKQLENNIVAVIGKDRWRQFKDGVCMMGNLSIVKSAIRDVVLHTKNSNNYVASLMSGKIATYEDVVSKVVKSYPELTHGASPRTLLNTIESIQTALDRMNLKLIGGKNSKEFNNWVEYCNLGTKAALVKMQMNSTSGTRNTSSFFN